MVSRGVIYMIWGSDQKVERALVRSKKSLSLHHPELPVEVIRGSETDPFKGLLEKAKMFDLSPFDETLYLDADTVVLGNLDFGFRKAQEHVIACSICECPWASRYGGLKNKGEIVEYNTGVLFFDRKAANLFKAWAHLAPLIDSSAVHLLATGQRGVMPFNDQASFAAAVEEMKLSPFVLPLNWNFRPIWQKSFFGPVKIWHDYADPPAFFGEAARYYGQPDAIFQYHTQKQ